MLKVTAVRTQVDMKKVLVESRGKKILVINQQRIWLNCFLVFSGIKNLKVEEISNHTLKVWSGFSLLLIVKNERRKIS